MAERRSLVQNSKYMKQLIHFLFLIPAISYSQDRIKNVNGQYEMVIHIKDGMGKRDSITGMIDAEIVNLTKSGSIGRLFSSAPITDIFLTASTRAQSSLNEESSYELYHGSEHGPVMILRPGGTISVSWEFLGQNSYGAKKWALLTIDFDLRGREVSEVVQHKE